MNRWHNFKQSRLGRFLRRYWWAYPAFLVVKWGTIGALGYTAAEFTRERTMKDDQTPSRAGTLEGAALNLKAGDRLPDFELPCWQPGSSEPAVFRSQEQIGQPLIIFFYPADDTPG